MIDEATQKEAQSAPPTKVTKTWFIEKENGEIFAIDEKGAWNLLYNQNRNNLYSRKYKIVGVSSGKKYVEIIQSSQNVKIELESKLNRVSNELNRYIGSLDRLKFDEFLPDDDEKVMRANAVIQEKEQELEKLKKELADIDKTIVKKAFDAELEEARGNIEKPANQDVHTPNADPVKRNKLLNILGK